MPVFMAGASRIGAFVAKTVVDSMSSAMPHAIFAMIFAVAGAMAKTSARFASAICSTSHVSGRANVSVTTGWLLSVSNVSGCTNCAAFFVMMTCVSTPSLRRRETISQLL